MTIDQMQEKLNKRFKNRKKGKVQISFLTPEEKKVRFMERLGDTCLKHIRTENMVKLWKQKNKKG